MIIVIHYSEIGLKGKNRAFFEKKLAKNIKSILSDAKTSKRYGKIIVETGNKAGIGKYIETLPLLPGVSSFACARESGLNMEEIKKTVVSVLKKEKFETFRITTKRSNKIFTPNSSEINVILGDLIRKGFNKTVNLKNPGITLYVEISEKEALVYTKKYGGIGGLPVGSSGKAVTLLSGGIDSPVASFLAMKRGLKVVFVHILNKTMNGTREGAAKIEKIVKELAKIQGESKLYVVPFEEIQKAIIASTPAEYRMIIYRRFMMRIAEEIAEKEKAEGIITGDSIGQVASQTLPNLNCIYEGVNLPVLPPLIGMNKEEIIKIARNIGTYELSIIPYPDCCSFLIAKHPETRGNLKEIEELEKLIKDKNILIQNSVAKSEIMNL